ncbi:MAG: GntR family transcriptional regulator [Thermodesulfobacteriota bacterium]
MRSSQNNHPEVPPFKEPETLARTVARYLEKEIIEGRLRAGLRLVPEELAKRFRISKMPVRDALMSLQKDGLVTNRPRIGFFVADINLADIEEIYPLRAALNALAVKIILEQGYDHDFLTDLEAVLENMAACVQSGDINEYFYLNVRFYEYLLEHCPNRRLNLFINQLGKQTLRFRFMSMSQPGHIQNSLRSHRRLFQALRERDVEAAQKAAQEIIYQALAVLRQYLGELGGSPEPTLHLRHEERA